MIETARQIVGWYAVLAAIGACGLLPATVLFDRLHTRGVLYARPLALAVVALASWLVAWLGWMPYGTPLAAGSVLALAAWSATIAWRRPELLRVVLERRAMILVGEALCLAVFALVLLARAQAPDAAGTEKPMDLMVLTAVHEAGSLPPPDAWLSGATLSYYHLGHLWMDIAGRLSGNGPATTFNLATATTGALAALAVAGVAIDVLALGRAGSTLRRGTLLVAGGGAVAMLLLVTPLVGLVNLAAAYGLGDPAWWAALGVDEVPIAAGTQGGVPTAFWWWWTSTRVLPGTINEFPAFSLLLGDPHAHLLALPLGLVAVALAVATFEGGTPLTWRRWAVQPERLLLTAAVFAAVVMANTWDVAVYGGLWAAAAVVAFLRTGWGLVPSLIGVVRWGLAPGALALALAWGFLRSIDAPPLGLAPVTGEHSDPARWLLVWLPALLIVAASIATLRPRITRAAIAPAAALALLPVVLWAAALLASGASSELAARGSGWVTLGGLALAVALTVAASMHADGHADGHGGGPVDRGRSAALALLGAALIVLLALEVLRVDDAFPGRLNTVFKFGFNAWALLAIAGGALAGLAWERATLPGGVAGGILRRAVPAALGLALAASLYVPAMALSRANEGQAAGLDSVMHLQRDDPGLYATIDWARDHLDPARDVVVQAIGESYTAGNMLSAATGVPTLLGWPNHQRQWRSSVPEAERRSAVEAIYGGGPEGLEVARRFGVTYVYIGREERAAYGADVASRFAEWDAVVEAGDAMLVRVP